MAEYRLYFVDAEGRRTGCAEFSGLDDQSAHAQAEQLVAQGGGELWRGSHWMNTWIAGDGVQSTGSNPLPRKTPSGNRQRAAHSGWTRRRRSSAGAGA